MDNQIKDVSIQLYREVLNRGDDLEIKVGGSSMWPFIKDGEVLVLRKAPLSDIAQGDVIATYSDQRLLCHRVFEKGEDFVRTKADALVGMDAKAAYTDVLGKVIAHRHNDRLTKCEGRLSILKGQCILWCSFLWAPVIPLLRCFKKVGTTFLSLY